MVHQNWFDLRAEIGGWKAKRSSPNGVVGTASGFT
jgi:hypothetical protein